MTRQLRPDQQALLISLRDRLLLTLDFFAKAQEFESAPRYRAHVERAAQDLNLRDMRLMAREIDQMSIALTQDQRDGLEALLKERLGVDKERERADLKLKVSAALKRGNVVSEKERRHLEDYAEMLEAIGGDESELKAVRAVLSGVG